jgi:hypothetical protein
MQEIQLVERFPVHSWQNSKQSEQDLGFSEEMNVLLGQSKEQEKFGE